MQSGFMILPWDTDFFGFTVAKILPSRLSNHDLENILTQLDRLCVSLVYWACDPADRESRDAGLALNGFLADKKVTYKIDLKNAEEFRPLSVHRCIEEYSATYPDANLENLAIQAGVYSRFNIDPKIGKERFEKLYRLWIKESVSKTIADSVLVFKEKGKAIGMVTLSAKNGYGSIGLMAVDRESRGNKVGQRLLRAARDWFVINNCTTATVKTQANNIAGCRLYEKGGYRLDKLECCYHFWI